MNLRLYKAAIHRLRSGSPVKKIGIESLLAFDIPVHAFTPTKGAETDGLRASGLFDGRVNITLIGKREGNDENGATGNPLQWVSVGLVIRLSFVIGQPIDRQ